MIAEVIYPTTGMMLCNHRDIDYKQACFDAYNLWLAEFCAPIRTGLSAAARRRCARPEEGIEELRKIKSMGFRGVMMPGNPGFKDYDDRAYDEFYEAAVEMKLPLSFHILTSKTDKSPVRSAVPRSTAFWRSSADARTSSGRCYLRRRLRAPSQAQSCVCGGRRGLGAALHVPHGPCLQTPSLLAAAGQELSKLPSEYYRENVYTTFQDDWVAFKMKDMCNIRRLLWANDFPHSDSTWPWSQDLLKEHRAGSDR